MSLPTSQKTLLKSTSITYRNAIYEGLINQEKQTRKDFGIVYLAKTHQFICCNNWHNDNLEGQCLFYNDHQQYVYGTWINNLPQGFNVFRFNQVVLMTVFNRGKLSKNSRVLIIFEKYNLAAILLVLNDSQKLDDLELQLLSKAQVFSPEDVNGLFRQCNWPDDYFMQNQTLIKYISHKLTRIPVKYQSNSKNQPKLRLIENKYYRFGFDQGLAIIFDQDFNRISVGCHSKTKLKSFGIVFDQKPKPLTPYNKPQQGKIIKITPQKTIIKNDHKNQLKRPQNAQPNLKTNLLIGVNFCNKFFKNPSKFIVSNIQNIISQQSIKRIIAGSLTTRRMFEQTLDFSKIQDKYDVSSDILEKELKKQNVIAPVTHIIEKTQKTEKQKLTDDRLRLQAIKKQIYDSLQRRKQTIQNNFVDGEYSREIINKQIVGGNHKYGMETPSRAQKSISRKKIFEESQKNIKLLRDFTPTKSQPNLTPFKAKMKHRIFNGAQSKNNSSGGLKNNSYQLYGQNHDRQYQRQIFQNEEEQIQGRNFQMIGSNNFSSQKLKERELKGKGKIRDLRNKDPQMIKQEQNFFHKTDERHVTFQDRLQQRDFQNANEHFRQNFETGKNLQYVPINTIEQKQKKRLAQNHSSHKQSRGSDRDETNLPNQFNNDHQYKYQLQQNQKRPTPKSKYYLEQKQSRNIESKSFKYQNQQNKQQYIIPKDFNQGYERRYLRDENEKQRQRQQHNFIYQDDTFKQTTLPEEFDSNNLLRQRQTTHDKNKRLAFRNSNEVYLDQLKQKYSPVKSTQTYANYHKERHQNIANRTMPYMIPLSQNKSNNKDNYNNSYRVKHMMKKSIEKDISRSPDRIRCYGKNMNNPYIQASPKYSKQGTYMMSYNNYESPHILSRNKRYNMSSTAKNQRGRFF